MRSRTSELEHPIASGDGLERDVLTHEQRRKIAETLSTRATTVEIESTVIVDTE